MELTRAWIGLGSNLGDRVAALDRALAALEAGGAVRVVRRSTLHETAPVGGPPQPCYLNGVAEVVTALEVAALGGRLLAAEAAAGRRRGGPEEVRWGPRPADLDLLLCGERGEWVVRVGGWTVPHPRMHQRDFVLRPLCELGPTLVHPILGRTMAELLAGIEAAARNGGEARPGREGGA